MRMPWFGPLLSLLIIGCGDNTNIPLAGDIASITVEANATQLYATQQVQMTATAHFTHGIDDRNVTENVRWEESNRSIATVDAVGRVRGTEYGGNVEITGSYKQFGESVVLQVIALQSVRIDANETNLSQEQTLQLRATGTFEDGKTLDVTDAVTWMLGNTGESNASLDQNGTLYTGDANGSLEINVTRYDINDSLSVIVSP